MAGSGVDRRFPNSDIFPNVRRAGRGLSPTPGLGQILNNRPQGASVSVPLTGSGNPLNGTSPSAPSSTDTGGKPNHFQNIVKLLAPALGLLVGGRQGLAYGTQFSTGMMDEEDAQKKEAQQQAQLDRQNKLADSLDEQRQAGILGDAFKIVETGGPDPAKGFIDQALPNLSADRRAALSAAIDSYNSSKQAMEKARNDALAIKNKADRDEKIDNANRLFQQQQIDIALREYGDVSKVTFVKGSDGFLTSVWPKGPSPRMKNETEKANRKPNLATRNLKGPDGKNHTYAFDPETGKFSDDQGISAIQPKGAPDEIPGDFPLNPGLDDTIKVDASGAGAILNAKPKPPVQPATAQPDTTGVYSVAQSMVGKKVNPDTGKFFASISEARAWLLKNMASYQAGQ